MTFVWNLALVNGFCQHLLLNLTENNDFLPNPPSSSVPKLRGGLGACGPPVERRVGAFQTPWREGGVPHVAGL